MKRSHGLTLLCSCLFAVAMSVVVSAQSSSQDIGSGFTVAATDGLPAWSPDGTKIVFESDRDGSSDIFVMDGLGGTPVNLTRHSARDRSPAWSPDGSKIAFESNRAGIGDIFVMNADGSNLINLTQGEGQSILPAWSPDGSKIVFCSSRGDGITQNIYVMDADGSNPTLLYKSPTAVYQPVFSPDGSKIAFMGGGVLYLIDADDGGNLTQITTREVHGSAQKPVWSPDGTRIAFQSNRSGSWDIYVMNLDGSGLVNLTNDGNSNTAPTWSPDGEWIAYVSKRGEHSNIYALKVDGSSPEPVQLTDSGYIHIKTWGSDESPENPLEYGADANPTGDPIGGGVGYSRPVTSGDFEVSTKDELLAALRSARAGDVVYVLPDAKIDLTGEKEIVIPPGVTLAGNRGHRGAAGPLIFTDYSDTQYSLLHVGEGVRITGLRIRGPEGGTQEDEFPPEGTAGLPASQLASGFIWYLPTSRGIVTMGPNVEVDNNEIYNWTWSGIDVRHADAHIHHNHIHHVQRRALGYPIVVSGGTALIEGNYFDYYRHAIASTGRPGSGYEARYNVVGPNATEFAFDMHGGRDFCRNDESCTETEKFMAGEWIHIHHNTFMNTQHSAIGIRGVPLQGGSVYKNWFYHVPDQRITSFPVIVYGFIGNLEIYDNVYGPDRRLIGFELEHSPLVRQCGGSRCDLENVEDFKVIGVVDPLTVDFMRPEFSSKPAVATGRFPVDVAVDVEPHLDVERVEIRIDEELIYSGVTPPKEGEVWLDTLALNDGLHTLTLEVFHSREGTLKVEQLINVANWWDLVDTFQPPQRMGWFGEIDFSKTLEVSPGWSYASDAADQFFGDDTRRVRHSDSTEYLVWEANNLREFSAVVYLKNESLDEEAFEKGVRFEVRDGDTWYPLPFKARADARSNGWLKVIAAGGVPHHLKSSEFRLTVKESIPAGELALGELILRGIKGSQKSRL